MQMAKAAYDQFIEVLRQDPKNAVAMASIASLYFNQKKFDEAQEWYTKLITADPKNKEAYYTIGVIAWSKTFAPRMEARAKLGMKPEDPGPIKDKKVREELKAKHTPIIESGIQSLSKALEIDPRYDDAMAYMNLLHRERGDLADNVEGYKKDTEIADNWVQKTLETKKIKQAEAEKSAVIGISQEETK
jgi:tetratricopeptide (TPR) repeat protein